MKTIPSGLLTSHTLCACLYVLRTDGDVEAFTSADQDVTVDSIVYRAATGFDITNLVSQSGLAVDNMELTVLPDETSYPQVDILAGRWNNAAFRLFEVDYTNPAGGINLLKRGTTGEADTLRATNRFEFRGLKQALQQQAGRVTTKTCPYRLGSTAEPDGLCMVDLGPYTVTYVVTAVASRREFTCAAATEADDWYKEGSATGTVGDNSGYAQKVKAFAAGVFTLSLPMPFTVQVGDTFTVIAGCQKRLDEDCKTKFDNVLNFGGEPHMPGQDLLLADPVVGG